MKNLQNCTLFEKTILIQKRLGMVNVVKKVSVVAKLKQLTLE